MTARLKRIVTVWWLWGLLGMLALCALIWFAAPLIALGDSRPLGGAARRLSLVLAIVAAWGLTNLWLRLRQARANARMVDEMSHAERERCAKDEADRSAAAEELAAIRHRSDETLALLRGGRFGRGRRRRYLYQLPWYVVIGPPGSGKTTAVLKAGLHFPLEQRLGQQGMAGLGGTRNTDWWLSDDALLIDTAGRYTTQDSRPEVDAAVWTGFLGLLKRHRPRQPINGALVVISPCEMAAMEPGERLEHAVAIRRRLLELRSCLDVRFPIYVVFSKLDLVLGFAEFFDTLGREERNQVWGATLPFDDGRDPDGAAAQFGDAFDQLLVRLEQRVVRRLQEEADSRRRAHIVDFPIQLAALKPVMGDFLDAVFRPNRYEGKLLLRGFYLTSSTQQGLPGDLLAPAVAPAFGLPAEALRPLVEPPAATPRSCFLPQVFRDVVFAEASLVGVDERWERRRRLGGWVAAAVAAIICAGLGAAWSGTFGHARTLLADAVVKANRLDSPTAAADRDRIGWPDLADLLDGLKALPAQSAAARPLALYDGDAVTGAARQAYERGLRLLLLPRLLAMAEDRLGNPRTPQLLAYQTLKVYLMLGRKGPLDPALVTAWFGSELSRRLGEDVATRQRLETHAAALLARLPQAVPVDAALISDARSRLSNLTLASRGYDMVRQLEVARSLPVWRPGDHAGAAAAKVFVRPSGRSLWDGISGLYTRAGFFDVFLPASVKIAQELSREAWVLGPGDRGGISAAQRIREDMLSLYLDDYARAWDDLLVDMVVVPFRSPAHAADVLNILAGPSSPLKTFLVNVTNETDLDKPPAALLDGAADKRLAGLATPAGAGSSLAEQAIDQAGQAAAPGSQLTRATFLALLKGAPPPGHPVTVRFAPVRGMVRGENGAPPAIDALLKHFAAMYTVFNKMARAPAGTWVAMANSDEMETATGSVVVQADSLPVPVDTMVGAVAESAVAVAIGGARQDIDTIWHTILFPACQAVVDKRYPFDPASRNDAPLADFSALLGPDGKLDQFFNTHLKPFVDTTSRPWRWRAADGVDLDLPPEVLRQFERAAELRQALFGADGKAPSVRFDITPLKVGEAIDTLLLDVDGQNLVYHQGPAMPVTMQWPAPQGPSGVRLSFGPARSDLSPSIMTGGPYGFLRLLDAGRLVPVNAPDRFRLEFTIGNRQASFILQAGKLDNLFAALPELTKFRCPTW